MRIIVLLACLVATGLPQRLAGPQRDLKVEKEPPADAPRPAAVLIPRSYALVVGISKYRGLPESWQLQYPERDAEAVYSILISPEGGNFRMEDVHTLIGPEATLAGLRREIDTWLPSVAQNDDRVLIYFAGHGLIFDGKGYLAPYDIDLKRVGETAYGMDTLGAAIGEKIRARTKILLTDACHSGAITSADTQRVNRTLTALQKSLFSFTASRDRERSFESPDWGGGHGVFTYYVVKGMEGFADENGNGVVAADELAEYVRVNVRAATGGQQNPSSDRGSFDPAMLMSYVPSRVKPTRPPPPKHGALVFQANTDGVEIWVDGKSMGMLDKGKRLTLPGLKPGAHTVKGVKMGFEPDGPREEMVYPGQESAVGIAILIARRRSRAASDALDAGLKYYRAGFEKNYRKAAAAFEKALAADPVCSQAALYLGRAYNALFEQEKAGRYFRKAIEIDPDYLEARAEFGGMLLDIGNVDEAIRQFNYVLQRDSRHALALTLLAQAYLRKELYRQSIDSARKAIALVPATGEPHLWLGESLRLAGSYEESRQEYDAYLRLSDFDTGLAGQVRYYALGSLIGMGRRKRASQRDIWQDLRSLAYLGMCHCERKLARLDSAIGYCQKALTYDPDDPYSHFALALAYSYKTNETGRCEALPAALKHFRAVVDINPDLAEADLARQNIANILSAWQKLRGSAP
jgi:tetratricopeptide (TPR) repeat protein